MLVRLSRSRLLVFKAKKADEGRRRRRRGRQPWGYPIPKRFPPPSAILVVAHLPSSLSHLSWLVFIPFPHSCHRPRFPCLPPHHRLRLLAAANPFSICALTRLCLPSASLLPSSLSPPPSSLLQAPCPSPSLTPTPSPPSPSTRTRSSAAW